MDMSQVNEGNNRFVTRSSGRVGHINSASSKVSRGMSRRDPKNINDILMIYARLLDLQDKDDSELKCAISYGLKLWNLKKRKHKEETISGQRTASNSQNEKAATSAKQQSNSLH